MEFKAFVSYCDVYKRDISFKESLFFIKLIYGKYRKDVILSFLGYISRKIGVVYTEFSLFEIQREFGIESNRLSIHPRSILVLYQIFYDSIKFSENSTEEVLHLEEVSLLFLYANQILNKTDFEKGKDGPVGVNVQLLMSMMKMYVGTIHAYEISLTEEYFIKFYEKLSESGKFEEYNTVLKKETNLGLIDFITVLKEIKERHKIDRPFELFDKFAVLKFENIEETWKKREPKIPIPNEYRFLELYPLIKRGEEYYGVPPIYMFLSLIRKPYHVLSNENSTKDTFRGFWGSNIVEPIIKQYIREIFESKDTRVYDLDFQKILGFEPADIILINNDDIFLLEIKSGYMGLADRYGSNIEKFKTEFDKKYIYNSTGKHQLINQLDIFENNYRKISKLLDLNASTKYKVFSCSIVFDEALTMVGFKRYLGKIFNEIIKDKMHEYTNILPFLYPNTLTFTELLSFERRIIDIKKRITLFKFSFNYEDSLSDFFNELKDNTIAMDGIVPVDIS